MNCISVNIYTENPFLRNRGAILSVCVRGGGCLRVVGFEIVSGTFQFGRSVFLRKFFAMMNFSLKILSLIPNIEKLFFNFESIQHKINNLLFYNARIYMNF